MACIAGWALTLSDPKLKRKPLLAARLFRKGFKPENGHHIGSGYADKIQGRARRVLKLTAGQASKLFHRMNWPGHAHLRLHGKRVGTKGYAQAVSDRIDEFIENGGAE